MISQTPLNQDALEAGAKALDPGVYRTFEADLVKHAGFSKTEASEYVDAKKRQLKGMARSAVSAYLADALPEVTTVEELDVLPVESVIRSVRTGRVRERFRKGWLPVGGTAYRQSAGVDLPARVLHRPEVKA